MHCLVVSCVFPPEPVASSRSSWEIAEALVADGWDITVVTAFPNRPAGRVFAGYSRRLYSVETVPQGFRLIRCFGLTSRRSGLLSRFLENASFGVTSAGVALLVRRPDAIYSNTWPVFATGLLHLVAALRRIPVVTSVQDVYPESLLSQGRIGSRSILVRVLRSVDRWIACRSAAVVPISVGIADLYRRDRKVPPERLHVVPNWASPRVRALVEMSGADIRRHHSIPHGAFLSVYAGNIGVGAGVEGLLEAFARLDHDERHYLIVAGEGSRLEACREQAASLGCVRVRFHSPWRLQETGAVMSGADVLLLPTLGNQSLVSLPSKLIAYLLVGRPIVATAQPGSDLARIVEKSGAGWVLPPDRPEELARLLVRISRMPPEELAKRGACGRVYAREHLTAEACLPRILQALTEAATGGRRYRDGD